MDKNQLKNENSVAHQIQLLLKTEPNFRHKLKQCLLAGFSEFRNPFEFTSSLFSKGILCDGHGTHKTDESFGLKHAMLLFTVDIACSNGADAIDSLMKTLDESRNSNVSAAIRAWCEETYFALQPGCSEPKGGRSVVQAPVSTNLPKGMKLGVIEEESVSGGPTKEASDPNH